MPETAPVPRGGTREEHLVALRRDVLNDVEHALGNLLQRMHHVARSASGPLAAHGERLQSTLDDLERLLELLFDYVSPVEVELRPAEARRVAESLAAQLRAQGLPEVELGAAAAVRVLADTRLLGRSFALLAEACVAECDGSRAVTVEAVQDGADDRVAFRVRPASVRPAIATPRSSMAEAVAGRLIELQGGELQVHPQPTCARAVVLPTAG